MSELERALDQSANDNDVKVIAFTGEGKKAFASGSDLSEVKDRNLKKALEPIIQGLADKMEKPLNQLLRLLMVFVWEADWKLLWL